jgi:hypothetical protein
MPNWTERVAQRTKDRGFGQAERKVLNAVPRRVPGPPLVWGPADFVSTRQPQSFAAKPWMKRLDQR